MPKKLIRNSITRYLKPDEWEIVCDMDELNKLYALKIREELEEVQNSNHNDVYEFADLIQVVQAFANINGYTIEDISRAVMEKTRDKGGFKQTVLLNPNPDNPSNRIYFE